MVLNGWCWLLLGLSSCSTASGFLQPLKNLGLTRKWGHEKVPLLQKNGANYRVFFRPEFGVSDSNNQRTEQQAKSVDLNKLLFRRKRKEKNLKPKKRSNSLTATVTSDKPFQLKSSVSENTPTNGSSNGETGTDTESTISPDNLSGDTGGPVCRIVTLSDGQIPTGSDNLPKELMEEPRVLEKLDSIFHAISHEETRRLEFCNPKIQSTDVETEEKELASVVRTSLEDAGFQLLTRRDLDLCDALNAGYLLRLSIVPDVSELDDGITKEIYPEYFDEDGNLKSTKEMLFDGKVLVFWRGYSEEVSRGRLLLPKLDYLQASIVQRAAAWARRKLGTAERNVATQLSDTARKVTAARLKASRAVADCFGPDKPISRALRTALRATPTSDNDVVLNGSNRESFFKLSRYGGSKIRFIGSPDPMDSLEPFVICEDDELCELNRESGSLISVDDDMYNCLNHDGLRCPYDIAMAAEGKQLPPMQLLERVTVSNLVNPFSSGGRQSLINSFFAKSKLVEPTYEEVVVVWRQKESEDEKLSKPVWTPPKLIYELADMFDYEGLPALDPPKERAKPPLQIRTFDQVPMANLPAVMPKTKLVFRPADAFVFDFISIATLAATFGSLKFTSPKLDLIAVISLSLWIVRFAFRYSNKLARYDLLVKTFLTSKISHRNAGALKYLVGEAGGQRAARAALVHSWLTKQETHSFVDRETVLNQGMMEVNDMVNGKQVRVDIGAALNDLEDIGLVTIHGDKVVVARDSGSVSRRIRHAWNDVLDSSSDSMAKLVGRRERSSR